MNFITLKRLYYRYKKKNLSKFFYLDKYFLYINKEPVPLLGIELKKYTPSSKKEKGVLIIRSNDLSSRKYRDYKISFDHTYSDHFNKIMLNILKVDNYK
jgi:hypothetical protein